MQARTTTDDRHRVRNIMVMGSLWLLPSTASIGS
jgi:hypothetical protein